MRWATARAPSFPSQTPEARDTTFNCSWPAHQPLKGQCGVCAMPSLEAAGRFMPCCSEAAA
eukprot:206370-Amphidinium_carterae.1